MSSRELRESGEGDVNQTSNEVQFALVIARMLETVKTDPELMRRAVYDLARHKLEEQLVGSDPIDIWQAKRALESAIRGVEEFSKDAVSLPAPGTQLSPAPPPRLQAREVDLAQVGPGGSPTHQATGGRRHPLGAIIMRTGLVLMMVGVALIAVQQRERLTSLGQSLRLRVDQTVSGKTETPPVAATVAPPTPPPPPAFPRPADYGVYALRDNTFTELPLLPGRSPDSRVAVSAVFKLPGKASLPDGHPEFVVFRRDAGINILERTEIRVIARIAREFSAEAAGKKVADGDAWVIRNFSYPYRASPIPDNPELYRLHSEDPALQLPAGNYALILKNQSYYFSVEGDVTDPRQCIERVVTANGTYYSACQKP